MCGCEPSSSWRSSVCSLAGRRRRASWGPALLWSLFAIASLAALSGVFLVRRRWDLPLRVLGLAVLLLAVGAGALTTTDRVERRRREGFEPKGIWRLFTRTNVALGGVLALGLWAVAATLVAVETPALIRSSSILQVLR